MTHSSRSSAISLAATFTVVATGTRPVALIGTMRAVCWFDCGYVLRRCMHQNTSVPAKFNFQRLMLFHYITCLFKHDMRHNELHCAAFDTTTLLSKSSTDGRKFFFCSF